MRSLITILIHQNDVIHNILFANFSFAKKFPQPQQGIMLLLFTKTVA